MSIISQKTFLQKSDTKLHGPPIRVLITGAAGQIAYALILQVGIGNVFGNDQPIILHLLDTPAAAEMMKGVLMEIHDCAFPLVKDVITTIEPSIAFKDIDVAFLIGSRPRNEGLERKELLSFNVRIFKTQGEALEKYAKKSVIVLVVGNPANTNAFICSKYAPSIPRENFTAMARLDQNRAVGLIALRLKVPSNDVRNVIIWGNQPPTLYPDVRHAVVNLNGQTVNVEEAINDETWLHTGFIRNVQTRGTTVTAARKLSAALSAAKAAGDHMRDIWFGTPRGLFVSMAVYSDGSYGTPKDVFFSFPVSIINKKWTIVQGLPMNDFAITMMHMSAKELLQERDQALKICHYN